MNQLRIDRALLARALAKVNDYDEKQPCSLTMEEAGALRAFLDSRPAGRRFTLSERSFFEQVEQVLKSCLPYSSPEAATEAGINDPLQKPRRTQFHLRDAIDKLQSGQYEAISKGEHQLLRKTHRILREAGKLDDENRRLHNLLTDTLSRYNHFIEAAQ